MEETIRKIANRDDRVESIDILDVTKADDDPDRVNVSMRIESDADEFNDLVFPLTIDR